jgi:hypothetical protein
MEAPDFGPFGGCSDGEDRQASVHPDEPVVVLRSSNRMAALRMEVAGLNVETDVPAVTVPGDGGEQDPCSRRTELSTGADLAGLDRAQQPSQPSSIVVHPDLADGRKRHRPGLAFADADQLGATLGLLVTYPEAVPAATFALALGEVNPPSLAGVGP